MSYLNNLLTIPPYSLEYKNKENKLFHIISELEQNHLTNCPEYGQIFRKSKPPGGKKILKHTEDFPYIPVRLFKELELVSTDKSEIKKIMQSSGTSGQSPSKIFLDNETSANQTKVLSKILSSYLGNKRLPMLIIDSKSVLKNRNSFSARGAGILGFSMFGRDVHYALDENMNFNTEETSKFLTKYQNEKILLFGFTYIVWENFYKQLEKLSILPDLSNGILIHGGGWKKMISQAVDNKTFKSSLNKLTGIKEVYNYYGLVEQTGSIFMECEEGYLHASNFSDIFIREHINFELVPNGNKGLIQLVSTLAKSYPGHSILTEDLGTIHGIDDCKCGRKGKYFTVHGRIENAEIRGCSDTVSL